MTRQQRQRARTAGWMSLREAVEAGTDSVCDARARTLAICPEMTPEELELAVETYGQFRARLCRWLQINRPQDPFPGELGADLVSRRKLDEQADKR
jgi:hypothetical protein